MPMAHELPARHGPVFYSNGYGKSARLPHLAFKGRVVEGRRGVAISRGDGQGTAALLVVLSNGKDLYDVPVGGRGVPAVPNTAWQQHMKSQEARGRACGGGPDLLAHIAVMPPMGGRAGAEEHWPIAFCCPRCYSLQHGKRQQCQLASSEAVRWR